jgi:hypothetical protein
MIYTTTSLILKMRNRKIYMRKFCFAVIILAIFNLIGGCDKGIEPLPAPPSGPTGFSGKVTFTGTWPESITRTHVIVFRNSITSISDFSIQNLAFVVDAIPYNSNEFTYNSDKNNLLSLTLTAGTYNYIVVAQSKTSALSLNRSDWVVVGVYYNNNSTTIPGRMIIQQGSITPDININVDFNNPPPQPPGG